MISRKASSWLGLFLLISSLVEARIGGKEHHPPKTKYAVRQRKLAMAARDHLVAQSSDSSQHRFYSTIHDRRKLDSQDTDGGGDGNGEGNSQRKKGGSIKGDDDEEGSEKGKKKTNEDDAEDDGNFGDVVGGDEGTSEGKSKDDSNGKSKGDTDKKSKGNGKRRKSKDAESDDENGKPGSTQMPSNSQAPTLTGDSNGRRSRGDSDGKSKGKSERGDKKDSESEDPIATHMPSNSQAPSFVSDSKKGRRSRGSRRDNGDNSKGRSKRGKSQDEKSEDTVATEMPSLVGTTGATAVPTDIRIGDTTTDAPSVSTSANDNSSAPTVAPAETQTGTPTSFPTEYTGFPRTGSPTLAPDTITSAPTEGSSQIPVRGVTDAPSVVIPETSVPTSLPTEFTGWPETGSPTFAPTLSTSAPTEASVPATGAPTDTVAEAVTSSPTTDLFDPRMETCTVAASELPDTNFPDCEDNPAEYTVMVDVQLTFPAAGGFASCTAAQEACINANIEAILNEVFPSTVPDWEGLATFGAFLFDKDQQVQNVAGEGVERQRKLQGGTCPTRNVNCEGDTCRWGCVQATTTDCGTSSFTNWFNLGEDIRARLASLELDCLGVAEDIEVVLLVDEANTGSVTRWRADTRNGEVADTDEGDPNFKTIPVRGDLTFHFYDGRAGEPTEDEITALTKETEKFFTDRLSTDPEFSTDFHGFYLEDISYQYYREAESNDKDVFEISFLGKMKLSLDTELNRKDAAQVMASFDFNAYIKEYVWNASPFRRNQFYETNEVSFVSKDGKTNGPFTSKEFP